MFFLSEMGPWPITIELVYVYTMGRINDSIQSHRLQLETKVSWRNEKTDIKIFKIVMKVRLENLHIWSIIKLPYDKKAFFLNKYSMKLQLFDSANYPLRICILCNKQDKAANLWFAYRTLQCYSDRRNNITNNRWSQSYLGVRLMPYFVLPVRYSTENKLWENLLWAGAQHSQRLHTCMHLAKT